MVSPLSSFLYPRSVAVIGATPIDGKVGHTLLRNLLSGTTMRVIYPVNPRRESVMGIRTFPSVISLPERPELAVIATPAKTVPEIIRECVSMEVPAALIISAGFRETGEQGRILEQEIVTHTR